MKKVLVINVEERDYFEEKVELHGAVSIGIYYHLKYKSYLTDVFDKNNIVVFSAGPMVGRLPGFSRGFAIFRSPLHGNLHISSAGAIGEYIKKSGYDALVITGKSENPISILIYEEKVKFLEKELLISTCSLEKEIYKEYKKLFNTRNFRVLVTGIGSQYSYFGTVVSSKEEGKIGKVGSIFGRGGLGTVLYNSHKVTAIAIGGERSFTFSPEYNKLLKEIIESTKKYRDFGTFKANFPHLRDKSILFNWNIFRLNKEKREEYYKKYIEGILLKGYIFKSDTCGEKCVASCKKIEDIKLDYEPVASLGPLLGIFKRDLVKKLVCLADSLGMDSIYLGNVLASLMEAIEKEYIDASWLNIKEKPILDPEKYDKDYSDLNYKVAISILDMVKNKELFLTNIRELSKTFNIKDLAVYVPYGKYNDMIPNMYWTLGLVLPVLVHGKYYSDYHSILKDPVEYSKICFDRTVKEFIIDNLGLCRFHRGWVEPKLNELIPSEILNESMLYLYKLYKYRKETGIEPEFFESKKAIVIYERFIEENGGEWDLKEYWNIFKKEYYNKMEELRY